MNGMITRCLLSCLQKAKCVTVSVEVRKSQHKYVIGPRGSALAEILTQTGVSVEVPATERY